MTYPLKRGGFGPTHLDCPCPEQEKRCCSEFADAPGRYFCHACGKVVNSSTFVGRSIRYRSESIPIVQRFFDQNDVMASIVAIDEFTAIFKNAEGHLECLTEYAELRTSGSDHSDAYLRSGWARWSQSRIREMGADLSDLPSFPRTFIELTHCPEVLSHFNVGVNGTNEVVFWITGPDGKVRNGHGIKYQGLNRRKDAHARYLGKSSDGYLVDEFFGAHQLKPSSHSWTGCTFAQDAEIIIVESPKTAILGSFRHPDYIWLASCGVAGVTAAKARHFKGRTVRLFFDNDQAGIDGAKRALPILVAAGARSAILESEKVYRGPRPDGWDAGDEILRELGVIV